MKKKAITILGSTGSIGQNTLKVIKNWPQLFSVKALAVRENIDLLEEQIGVFKPEIVAVFDEDKARILKKRVSTKVVSGIEGVIEVASWHSSDLVISAISGSIGLIPTVSAIKAQKDIGLANKEVLVAAGEYVTLLARKNEVNILPVDSEHNALFQCLENRKKQDVSRLVLTASGGPFVNLTQEQLHNVTLKQALKHPTWPMGIKNTIDSSTLMNKGLEVIEAYWLFDFPIEQIEVVIHPQSIVHSFVELIDGSFLAQLSKPDMQIPIRYVLSYPNRLDYRQPRLDFSVFSALEFFPPDMNRFSCLGLAYQALKIGKSMPCYMNGANEILVKRFFNKEISWMEIGEKLEKLMTSHIAKNMVNLESILAIDDEAKERAMSI